ncbi:NAD+ synthase [Saccharicrinis sp. FJH54]|uniref:NAD+ synthase n=1 Tax=Saccharicrinis sp. FJH54 TaxID=3344665 RepID=UPI0035D4BA1F
MKIALAQLNYIVSHFEYNHNKMAAAIEEAKKSGAELIVFSELSICGYPPHDLLEKREFFDTCMLWVNKLAGLSKDIAIIVGSPSLNENPRGKRLHNSAFFLNNGKIEKVFNKTLLPTYDVFDEYRYFEPNRDFDILEFGGKKFAVTICEDIWEKQPVLNPFAQSRLYSVVPMEQIIKLEPDMLINIAASPFSYVQEGTRKRVLKLNAEKYNIPAIYVNQVGANTELVFDGNSMAIDGQGNLALQCKRFEEDIQIIDTEDMDVKPLVIPEKTDHIPVIHDALILGIRDYFQKMGFKKATLGLSGGIDSAVTLVLAERALGAENIRVLLMPSRFSTDHSVKDAVDLAENLGIEYDILSIKEIYSQFEDTLSPVFNDLPFNVAEENIQARIRGTLVMALSNKFGHILLNTSNKSEAAVGYGTLYGDMNGGLSVLGDVYKSDVFKLAWYINRKTEIIPHNTIVKPPSAELRPDQKDSDSLPEYDILDGILFNYIELNRSPQEIESLGYDRATIDKTIHMVNVNEYKRFQTPPILRISSKAFGFGRRMPLVAKY